MLLELSLMLLENTYSTVVTYNCHSDDNYVPRVVNCAPREHLYYKSHLRLSLMIVKIFL